MTDDKEEKRSFVAKQFREACYQEGESVQQVTCGCGLRMPLRFAYKCLYCGEFYCQRCAEAHFGKTRDEYNKEKGNCLDLEGDEHDTERAQGVQGAG